MRKQPINRNAGLQQIERMYGVLYHRNQRVKAYGKPGTIIDGDGQYLQIRLDGQKHANNYHPTDQIEVMEPTT